MIGLRRRSKSSPRQSLVFQRKGGRQGLRASGSLAPRREVEGLIVEGPLVTILVMFGGGCAGSTGRGLKVIRHILFAKILLLEVEQAYHPSVVRPLRLGGNSVVDPDLRKNILVYFSLILVIFVSDFIKVDHCFKVIVIYCALLICQG